MPYKKYILALLDIMSTLWFIDLTQFEMLQVTWKIKLKFVHKLL